ncbi:Alpha/Beta hydrolase protein [Chiua virens]|nr:Alpha/Beta hydrolase protein [Chiua virens]
MTSVPSATTWGSPSATKHALLLHGLTSSSHTWYRVGCSLAAKGYFVTAPDLIGHGLRVSSDYGLTSVVEDLRPYLEARNYSLIIGHSFGVVVALSLFSHLPRSHPTAVLLIDPLTQRIPDDELDSFRRIIMESYLSVKPPEVHAAENPLWTPQDAIYRELATRLCSIEGIRSIMNQEPPELLDNIIAVPDKWKITILAADPAISQFCRVETLHPFPHIRAVVVPGAGHWIQCEFPEVIVEEALKSVGGLDTEMQ